MNKRKSSEENLKLKVIFVFLFCVLKAWKTEDKEGKNCVYKEKKRGKNNGELNAK